MKSLSLSTLLLLLAGLLLQACNSAESSTPLPTAGEAIPVTLLALQQQHVQQPITASGQFTTDDETVLSFKTGGIVRQVLVKEGERVRRGQLLATLDLTEIQAGVQQAELGYEKAKRDFARAQNLYRDSVATLEQYQNAQTGLALAEQQLRAARFNLGFSEIRAVADGFVLKRLVNPGQLVASGAAVLRTNGAGRGEWLFRISLSDKDWARVEVGDSASLQTDALPGHTLQALVVRKAEGVDPQSGAFGLELKVLNPPARRLASGLFGTAQLRPSHSSTLWRIPHEALLDGHASKGWVFITKDNKRAQKVAVSLAGLDGQWVYVSSGLEGAQSLITRGSAYLTDSSLIIPQQP
ncbi:efflux RND transporter periplasmic adaptor subunit [Cesiribacter andamanensis]|uniref:Multidrug resistance protein mexA n=1 Tax=Cesiribacter andamanensis AMV16 TaxID=1279009 RepID=M7N3W8_9BACT|nr:efflux RND transporter periplasmic adaptor subunit [Cesiribacter andamanensis]EMR01987.1 Multidrug resistance protein mexA precursor [Cesiribacter andamanensis AMV16]